MKIIDFETKRLTLTSVVRGISGGQRKRVNIGIELVRIRTHITYFTIQLGCWSECPIFGRKNRRFQQFFLNPQDEPTSGLDSASSKEICACLQKLTSTGITIVAVIHSPRYEIFEMFDDVLLLGKGGRTVYLGPTVDSLR